MSDDPTLNDDALSAYLDDELDADERRQVEARLASDAAWQASIAEVSAAREALRALPVRDAPPGFWPRVVADVGAASVEGTSSAAAGVVDLASRRRRLLAGVAAASVAAVLLAGALVPRGGTEVTPTLSDLSDAHAAEAASTGDPVSQLAPLAVPVSLRP